MSVEIIAIGGYEEVGKNMSAVKVGEDVIIFDMGINLDRVNIHEDVYKRQVKPSIGLSSKFFKDSSIYPCIY